MKKLFIILTLIVFILSSFSEAHAARRKCSAPRLPNINFYSSYGKLKYDYSRSMAEITKISQKFGMQEQGIFLSGLATIIVEKEYKFGTSGNKISRNKICVFPSEISVFIGYLTPTIYISHDLEPNSCEYNLVLRHEQTHQRINKKALDYFIPKFQEAAEKIAKEISPQIASSRREMEEITQEMTNEFAERMDKVVNVFKKELTIEQGKLDNKINYSMEGNVCRKFNATH